MTGSPMPRHPQPGGNLRKIATNIAHNCGRLWTPGDEPAAGHGDCPQAGPSVPPKGSPDGEGSSERSRREAALTQQKAPGCTNTPGPESDRWRP